MRPRASVWLCSALLIGATTPAFAQPSQTAQSAMVQVDFDNTAYEIEQTITWTFQRGTHREPGTAMEAYTNVRTAGPAFLGCTGGGAGGVNCLAGNAPSAAAIAAAEPAPDEIKLQQHAQAERCTFFAGGTLTSTTYTQQATLPGANTKGNWTYSWTYSIDPVVPVVAPHTAWTSEETGGTVDVGYSGFVASESFLKQTSRNKYSFTMIDGGLTRARNVSGTLQLSDGLGGWTDLATADLNNVDTDADLTNDGLAIVAAGSDFPYYGNGGRFGNSAVFAALHAASGKAANGVNDILTGTGPIESVAFTDNFAGNNNDLAAGNVHTGPFTSGFASLSAAGDYRVAVSGVLKGNSSSADFGFSVTSNTFVIGGCTIP